MQTIKTFVVVALLLTVCYGAYVAMNSPDVEMPEDLKTWANQSGNDVMPDFEIPAITSNDVLPMDTSPAATGTSTPQFPAIELPKIDSTLTTNLSASGSGLDTPQFPAIGSSLAAPNSAAAAPGAAQPTVGPNTTAPALGSSLAAPSLTANQPLPSSADLAGPAVPFNADLTSMPAFGAGTTSEVTAAGPAQPFNPEAPDSLANDLINAGANDAVALPLLDGSTVSSGNLVSTSPPTFNAAPATETPATAETKQQPAEPFSIARGQALQLAEAGKLREALEMLSPYYDNAELGYAEHTDLVDILDALSREVIYSDRPLLNPPYTVSAADTLESLATKHNINPELLAAINKMGAAKALVPNMQIKTIDGPFHAQVSLSRGELTLFLRKLYAGRFPVSISQKNRPPMARYEIVDRRQDRTYYGASVRIPAGDPTNPYGGFWLSLGSDYAIHGSPEQVTTDLEGAGCISLAPLDAADVYRILAKGCAVEIVQ